MMVNHFDSLPPMIRFFDFIRHLQSLSWSSETAKSTRRMQRRPTKIENFITVSVSKGFQEIFTKSKFKVKKGVLEISFSEFHS